MQNCTSVTLQSKIRKGQRKQVSSSSSSSPYAHLYTVVQKSRTRTMFSNNFNKYWAIPITFGRQNLQRVSNVHVCSLRISIKQGTSSRFELRAWNRQTWTDSSLASCLRLWWQVRRLSESERAHCRYANVRENTNRNIRHLTFFVSAAVYFPAH